MAKQAAQQQEVDDNTDIDGLQDVSFPPIGEESDADAGAAASTGDEDPVEARLKEIESKFDREREQWAERERRNQMLIDQLMQAQISGGQQQQTGPEPVNWDDLPDPVENPKEFQAAIARKTQESIEYANRTAQASTGSAKDLDAVWESFKADNPDLAGYNSTATGAVQALFAEYKNKGIDPTRAVLTNPDGFKSTLAERMRAELKLEPPTDNGADDGKHPTRIRTAGVSGGSKTRTKAPDPQKVKGFMSSLRDLQAKQNLI